MNEINTQNSGVSVYIFSQIETIQFLMMIKNINIPETLIELIEQVSQNNNYSQALATFKDKYNICGTNINSSSPQKLLQTYSVIKKKFYYERKNPVNCSWFQNELRIYILSLACYLYVQKKNISSMTFQDWSFFKPIFYNRDSIIFQFQGILLLKDKKSRWSQEQIILLDKIVKIKHFKNKWNSIARETYILSDKRFIKTPKQCRQRWLNYLDPSKVHSPWTDQQDLALLISIRNNGKKWAYAVKKILQGRTEHMVKNRFNSLMNNQKKKNINKSQLQLMNRAIQTAMLAIQENNKAKNQQNDLVINFQIQRQKIQQEPPLSKKKSSKRKQKSNKKASVNRLNKKISSLATLPSIPPQIDIEDIFSCPAEINKNRFPGQIYQLQFFEQSLSVISFNPFQQLSPNDQLAASNFFLYSQACQQNQPQHKKGSSENEQKINPAFQGNYRFF